MTEDIYPWSGNFYDLNADDQRDVAGLVVKEKAVNGPVDEAARIVRQFRDTLPC